MADLIFEVHTFPVLDTGFGIEAGYDSDAAMIAVSEATRAALPASLRELLDRIDADLDRRMLFGEG